MIYKYKKFARFGLMHLVGTNLCMWLNTIIEESKHEIDHYLHEHNGKLLYRW